MEREREGMGDFFKGFGSDRRMFTSIFGGRNPFDDPFFSRPFGSLFGSCTFGPRAASNTAPERPKEKGVLIEELDSDGEGQEKKENGEGGSSKSSNEPSVEHPDDEDDVDDSKSKNAVFKSEPYRVEAAKPQSRSYSAHTCKVTYGGVGGAYYASTRTRREGADGVVVEETKEADKSTGQAQHRISRGIHNKGHTVTRKLNSDGQVDTLQTLHNLDEGELAGFEEAWNTNKGDFPGWNQGFDMHGSTGPWGSEQGRDAFSGSWFLPSSEEVQRVRRAGSENEAKPMGRTTKKVVRINID